MYHSEDEEQETGHQDRPPDESEQQQFSGLDDDARRIAAQVYPYRPPEQHSQVQHAAAGPVPAHAMPHWVSASSSNEDHRALHMESQYAGHYHHPQPHYPQQAYPAIPPPMMWSSQTQEQQAGWASQNKPRPYRGRKRKAPPLWTQEDPVRNTEDIWASLPVDQQRSLSDSYRAEQAQDPSPQGGNRRQSSGSSSSSPSPRGKKKLGRPAGKTPLSGPAKTVAASTNAEKRQKIKNLFRKVASVDLCTDIENATEDDPSTKFVLVQVSTAPPPPVEGGGPHRKVVAEKVKTVTIYGGPSEDDLRRTLGHATAAVSGSRPQDYNMCTLHNIAEVESHFKRIEEERKQAAHQQHAPRRSP